MFNDPEETYSLKEKLLVAVLLLPVALVAMIGEKRRLRGKRNLIEDDGRGNGVVLNSGGREVVTP